VRPSGRILIVDDDDLFLANYRATLSAEGYRVEVARTREDALARLDEDDWDVVLLDQKLLGPSGPDLGIELVTEVHSRAPGAKPIIVTAYATDESITRAFAAGVYDFLEKKGAFSTLLRAKLRNAIEAVRARQLSARQPDETDAHIRELWATLATETDINRKGLVLEELMLHVFRSIDGFFVSDNRRRSEDEEIDLVIRNESTDPLWAKESPYFLVECKSWSKPCGRAEFDAFHQKLHRRFKRAKLGFFVAPGGVTEGFRSARSAERKGDAFVVCIGSDGLRQLVESGDRNQTLKGFHDRAVVDANGGSA
jgi:CheY-like chemotaxis protein